MNLIQKEYELSADYRIDTETFDGNEIVKLTRDNVARVEAMIKTDSDYKDSGNSDKKGSSAYWLKQLEEIIKSKDKNKRTSENFIYADIIYYLVIAIDIENSTHLNSDKIGRRAVADRISKLDIEKLVQYLKKPSIEYELIDIIQSPKEEGEKRHFSFATKFCNYACYNLFKGTKAADNFSKYDSVLEKALPQYVKRYLGEDVKLKEYKNNYQQYIKYIDNIREAASKETGEKISRNGFDHLLWYYHKGKN